MRNLQQTQGYDRSLYYSRAGRPDTGHFSNASQKL